MKPESSAPINPVVDSEARNIVKKRDHPRRTEAEEIIQNFVLIWLDEKIEESDNDYLNSIKKLRQTVKTIEIFHNTNECIDYMTKLKNVKSFLICSGSSCESAVPRIHNIDQIYVIYVFCRKKSKYEEWAKDWSKIKGVFVDIDSICGSVRQTARLCDEDSIEITAAPSLNQIEPSFMYTQLFKEIVLKINFDEKKSVHDLAEYAREKCPDDEIIDEFDREYGTNMDEDNKPIWWYTRECFLYHMLNKALGTLQVETLLKMGFFICDLHQNIKRLHFKRFNQQQIQDDSTKVKLTVYRGKTMTKKDFQDKIKEGGLMSFNNFLSTSEKRDIAIKFISEGLEHAADKNKIGVLFKMTVHQSTPSAFFARIKEVSYYKKEEEILFSTHTIFRIQYIKQIHENDMTISQVKLTLTNENDDQELNRLTEHYRTEITGTGWKQMGKLLWKLGHNDKAEEIYKMLLLEQVSDEMDEAYYYNELGNTKLNQGEYKEAFDFYEKTVKIQEKALPPNHPNLAISYNNIGSVYRSMGEYAKALSFFERSLEIRKVALPPNHPDLAISYNNIGMVYRNMGEYSKALSSFQRTLEIRKVALPPNHPNLAISYNGIGLVYYNMGEYSKALSSYDRSLEIQKVALPPNHPDLAISYNNIGMVYDSMGEYSKALSSHERSLEIRKVALRSNHPDFAISHNGIGLVYNNMGEYSQALSSYDRSLEIQKIALPPNHPGSAITYNGIGSVYRSMGEYSKALSSFERSLEIRKIALRPNHPDLAITYNNIGSVYRRMGEYAKALSSFERSLEIQKVALPPNHPDLAISYNNIGLAYNSMGEYLKALSNFQQALDIREQVLMPTHPDLIACKNSLEQVKQML